MKLLNKWYFYGLLVILFFVPSYADKAFDPADSSKVVEAVLSHPMIYQYEVVYGIMKIVFLLLLILSLYKKSFHKVLNYFIAFMLLLTTLFQTTANTSEYGFVILFGNAILNFIVVNMFIFQGIKNTNNNIKNKIGFERYILILLAFIAFYFPVNQAGTSPDFSVTNLLFNNAMVTFCMIIPVSLTISLLVFDFINIQGVKVISFIGIIFGIMNMLTWFVMNTSMWYMGILHLPLMLISLYTFIKLKMVKSQ